MEFNAEIEKTAYIDRYLRGELPAAERITFERRLREDEAFAEEVERIQSMRSIIRNYGYRKDLRTIHQEAMGIQRKNRVSRTFNTTLRIAATVTLLLVSTLAIRLFTLTPDSLFRQAYEGYQTETVRGEKPNDRSSAEQLCEEYANGHYSTVVQLYKQRRMRSIRETFVAANAYLALSQPSQAIPLLRQVMADSNRSGDFTYYQDAEYYLAWAYLKNNQLQKADAFFTSIYQNPYHPYHASINWWFYWQIKLLRLKQGV